MLEQEVIITAAVVVIDAMQLSFFDVFDAEEADLVAAASWTRAVAVAAAAIIARAVAAAIIARAIAATAVEDEEPFFAFSDGVWQVVAQEHPSVVIIMVQVLASLVTTIVIIAVVFIFSIIVKVAAGPMATFDVFGAIINGLYAAYVTEEPSVYRSRTLAIVSMAIAIIKAGHRVIIVKELEVFDGAAIEATAAIAGLEEVAASAFSTIIIEEALAIISSMVVNIAFTIIAWVIVEGFAQLKVELDRAGAGHSQALALTPQKDHLAHLHRRIHHHSHLLRRSSHRHLHTTVGQRHHLQLKGLEDQFDRAQKLKDSEAATSQLILLIFPLSYYREWFTDQLPFLKVQLQVHALPVSSGPFLASSMFFAVIWSYKGKVVELAKYLAGSFGNQQQPDMNQWQLDMILASYQDRVGMASGEEVEFFCHLHSHVELLALQASTLLTLNVGQEFYDGGALAISIAIAIAGQVKLASKAVKTGKSQNHLASQCLRQYLYLRSYQRCLV